MPDRPAAPSGVASDICPDATARSRSPATRSSCTIDPDGSGLTRIPYDFLRGPRARLGAGRPHHRFHREMRAVEGRSTCPRSTSTAWVCTGSTPRTGTTPGSTGRPTGRRHYCASATRAGTGRSIDSDAGFTQVRQPHRTLPGEDRLSRRWSRGRHLRLRSQAAGPATSRSTAMNPDGTGARQSDEQWRLVPDRRWPPGRGRPPPGPPARTEDRVRQHSHRTIRDLLDGSAGGNVTQLTDGGWNARTGVRRPLGGVIAVPLSDRGRGPPSSS